MGANRRELLVQAATRFAHEIADILDGTPAENDADSVDLGDRNESERLAARAGRQLATAVRALQLLAAGEVVPGPMVAELASAVVDLCATGSDRKAVAS